MAPRRPQSVIVFALTCLLAGSVPGLSGCNKTTPQVTGPGPATKSVGKPVSEEESLAVAEAINQAIDTGDVAALDRLIDWDAINQRTTGGVDAPEKFRKDFITGLESSRLNGKGLSNGIVEAVQKGGSYKLLHAHSKDDRPWLLFRLLLPESGVNYHDLLLARRPDGKVKVVDMFIYLSGELLSQTFRRGYVQAVAQVSGGLVNKLTGTDQKYVKYFKKLGEMSEMTRAGKFAEVLAMVKTLPPELQNERSVLLVRLQAAQNLGDTGEAEYSKTIEDYRTAYPKDACIDILSIDYYVLKKQYPQSLECIDRVDQAVEGDPYLQTIRASIHLEQGDAAAARADLKKGIEADPTLVDAYWSLITISLKDKSFDETLQTLRTLRDKFGIEIGDLKQVELYKEFSESPQYQEWLKDKKAPEKSEAKEKEAVPDPKE